MQARRIEISPEVLLKYFAKGERFEIVSNAVPADAKVVRVAVSELTGLIHIIVTSESYDDLDVGAIIPVTPWATFRRIES